jgi:hypothetical protein
MDQGIVQLLLSMLQPQANGQVVGQSALRQALFQAQTQAKTIVDNDTRNLWYILLRLINIQLLGQTAAPGTIVY